jgi:hypothetical protein
MDILNHFIDFMTCKMRWRMPLLDLTIELILHILKLVFYWNVVSMSHIHYFLWLAQILRVYFSKTMWTSTTYFLAQSWQVMCHWKITNSHKQNNFKLKVLMLMLILDLYSNIVSQHLQIFNQKPKISDVISRLLCPRYQFLHHNIFLFVAQPRRKVQNHQHN